MNLTDPSTIYDLPMDLNAERQVLGILIKYPTQVDRVIDRLRPAHFYDLTHRRIYEIIVSLYHKQGRISYTQIYNRLRADGISPTPAELLIPLTESFVALSELDPSVSILLHREAMRRLVRASDSIKAMALDPKNDDLEEVQARAQELIFSASQATNADADDAKNLL